MIKLDWAGALASGWACERDHLCAWIERLPVERRFAWTVDEVDGYDSEQTIILASGVESDLAAAQEAVAAAMMNLGASPRLVWRAREDGVVIDLFPER
ncbi:MAG: hypothetical protein WA973_14585 [Mesorhizobium sp.]